MIMSMHNVIYLHIIRKNRPMHRNAPASVIPAGTLAVVSAVISAVAHATTTRFVTTPR